MKFTRNRHKGSCPSVEKKIVLMVSILIIPIGALACGTGTAAGESTNENFEMENTTDSALGSRTEQHVINSSNNPDLFFPTQIKGTQGGEPRAVPESMQSGRLILYDDGCLRLNSKPSENYLLIWPPSYEVKVDGEDVRVLDEKNRVVAKTGSEIKVGGGEIPEKSLEGIAYLSKRLQRELPRRCTGPYWLVGEVMDSEQPG